MRARLAWPGHQRCDIGELHSYGPHERGRQWTTQEIIQTQRGYGYRFVAAVEISPEALPGEMAERASPAGMPPDVSAQEQTRTAPAPSLPQSGGTTEPLVPGARPCRACQYANGEDATFCAACGTRLRQPCSYCGQYVALPAVYCIACGQPLAPLSPADLSAVSAVATWHPGATSTHPHQGGFSAQRKPVTVLSCTVTTTADHEARVDLDALLSSMQALHDLARDVVQEYGGWLHSLVGDRLLVMFGVPVVQEDHARRAVRVALALRQRVHELRERGAAALGAPLALRIGLYTGLVVESRWDDTEPAVAVVGDVVSLAVGLQAQAEPGQILCSDATAHLVQETVRLEAVGPVHIAGQASPVAAYAVLGSSARRAPGIQHWERSLSPFVGREREMATLHALLTRVEAGRGQVVGVVGEAGIGKSRLISEFYRSLEGRRLTYLTGHCLSYGSATPYLPLLDLLRYNCGITEIDSPEDITAKVHRSLQEVEMPPETWAPVFLPLLGVQEDTNQLAALSPEVRKARILTAFTQLALNGSRQRPLVLEIEDLHWIDASSEECLAALVERMAGVPLLLLVTYRPGYRPAWIDKSYVTQVALHPLSSEDSLRVVQAVLPERRLSTPAVPHLLAKAEGNPFFLEELAQMVAEQGVNVSSSTVPDTVQAVLMARIDRLPATAKHLLQAAAVIGKDVALPLLQAMTDVPEEAIQRDLLCLRAAEFLYETYTHVAPVYTFKHILTQEVTYQSLVRQARQQCHARMAQVLEERFPEMAETQPELLAQHYTEAGLPEQALPYWQCAGQRALERSANHEAINHFTTGLNLLKTLPGTPARVQQELTLHLAMGAPLLMIKGLTAPEVEYAYVRAQELAQQLGETSQRFSVLMGLWRLYFSQARLQRARELAEQCFTLAQHLQDPVALQEAHLALGSTCVHLGELRAARAHLEYGIALYEPHRGLPLAFSRGTDPGVVCLSRAAWVLWMLGYAEQALTRSHEALALAQRSAHTSSIVFALFQAAVLRQCRREVPQVREQAEDIIRLATEQGFTQWRAGGILLRGWALVQQGAVEEGIAQVRQGHNAWLAIGNELGKTQILARLAEAYGQASRTAEGLEVLAEALAAMQKNAERHYEADLYRLKGDLLSQHPGGQLPLVPCRVEAESCFQQAIDVARRQGAKFQELRAVMSLGRLWQAQGKRQEAFQRLQETYHWFTEGFDTPDLQGAKMLLDAWQA